LVPDGEIAQKPYQLICSAMESKGLTAIGRMLISSREHMVRVRGVDGVLAAELLEYGGTARSLDEFKSQLADVSSSAEELKLTRQLIDSKVEGKELVAPAPVEKPAVVNLMDALRMSMERAKARPAQRKVSSAAKRPAKASKRKERSG
jgi:DNA end-binding protein Ku